MYQIPFLYVFTEGEDCLCDRPTHTSLGVNENVPPNASMAEPVQELHSFLLLFTIILCMNKFFMSPNML